MLIGVRQIFLICLAFGLAGCFTSETPLIDDDAAAAPFAKIRFAGEGEDKTSLAVRHDKSYILVEGDDLSVLRFRDYGDGLFVVELTGEADSLAPIRLYAVLKVDVERGRARAYMTMSSEEDVTEGLHTCLENSMCIHDLDAYAALGRAAIAAGAEPDEVYVFTFE